MSKLLNKPFKAFTLYALVILICSIPVYYLVIDHIWVNELDTHNLIRKTSIEQSLATLDTDSTNLDRLLGYWRIVQPEALLTQQTTAPPVTDSFFDSFKKNQYSTIDRYRCLATTVKIRGRWYHLVIQTNIEEAGDLAMAISLVTLVFFILMMTGFIILNKQLSKHIWQPFRNSLLQLKTFDLTEQKQFVVEPSSIEEFEELNQSLYKLINSNLAAYNQQRVFIENASHELQTPIAVLKTKVDLLLQQEDFTPEQAAMANGLNMPLGRLSRINKNLLLLAKIDNMQYKDERMLQLDKMIQESVELLADYAAEKKVGLTILVVEPTSIHCNHTLLEILLNNLLINAIRHNTNNGKIRIELRDRVLRYYNTGNEPVDEQTLFRRFATGSPGTGGNGLGLAIVKEICNRYQWEITYHFLPDELEHLFSIHLQK